MKLVAFVAVALNVVGFFILLWIYFDSRSN